MHVVGPMLATEIVSAKPSDTAKRHPCRIEQVPGLTLMLDSNIHTPRLIQCLLWPQRNTFVDNLVRYVIYPMSVVRIERDPGILRLDFQWLVRKSISLFHVFFHVD